MNGWNECPKLFVFFRDFKLIRFVNLLFNLRRIWPHGSLLNPCHDVSNLVGWQFLFGRHLKSAVLLNRADQQTAVGIARLDRGAANAAFQHSVQGIQTQVAFRRISVMAIETPFDQNRPNFGFEERFLF